jgi:hypothetical protein
VPNVKVTDYKVWVGDDVIPLMGGEVHYWRLSPDNWRPILHRVKDLGLQVVSTYVCWDFHEYAPGQFDFTGETNPQRNLVGFLDLLTEMDFWIVIRPGPYVYTEWTNAGVPDQAAQYHRLHPEFLRLARHYMETVVPILQPYFATRGGRIILFQADNEIDPWHQWYTEPLGMGQNPGLFHDFLRERYTSLGELNHAWSAQFASFEEAHAVFCLPPGKNDLLPRYLDFCRFKHWFVLKASRWMVDTYRDLGVDLPIYLNTYGSVAIQPGSDMEEIADLVSADLYPSNTFSRYSEEHRKFMDAVRYMRSYSRLPYISEFEAGIWHGWHYEVGAPAGNHYRLMCLSALAAGITGWSWYMLVNRDNWYMSPINEWGRVRPELYDVYRQVVGLFREMDPTASVRLTSTSVTFDLLQQASQRPGQELLTEFYKADIDYDFYELGKGKIRNPLLFYCGGAWLSSKSQEKLRQYVLDGGHLVCLGSYPRFDEQMRPLNLLEIPEPVGVIGDVPESLKLKFDLGGEKVEVRSSWMAYYQDVPGEPIRVTRLRGETLTAEEMELILSLVEGDRYTVGYTRSLGKGKLTVLNLAPSAELVVALHNMAGVNIPSRSLTPGITTALYLRGSILYLIVTNISSEDKVAQVLLDPNLLDGIDYGVEELITGNRWLISRSQGYPMFVTVNHKDAVMLKLTPTSNDNGDILRESIG